MSPVEWAALAVSLFTLISGFLAMVRWIVKHYLYELKPNGGDSLKDKVNALDEKVEFLTDIVLQVFKK
jgi:hypothetical protein